MRIDTIAVRLRMRGAHEASDLGVRLCQEQWRSVYGCFLLPGIPAMALCLATFEISAWLPMLLIWWIKPWLDRSALFALSRAAFGQHVTWRDLWRENRYVWRTQLFSSLTMRRLSPWRSLTQPIHQLEGLRGKELRSRVKQVRGGKGGSAMLMTSAYSWVEFSFVMSAVALLILFSPTNQGPTLSALFGDGPESTWFDFYVSFAYAVAVLFLEPLYVASGFGMYLSRRVELEAWDIEQELRRAFA